MAQNNRSDGQRRLRRSLIAIGLGLLAGVALIYAWPWLVANWDGSIPTTTFRIISKIIWIIIFLWLSGYLKGKPGTAKRKGMPNNQVMPARSRPLPPVSVRPRKPSSGWTEAAMKAEAVQLAILKTEPPKIETVTVPAGEFIMGQNGGMREDPAHPVTLAEYQIGRYPLTNAQYLPFVQDTGHHTPLMWPDNAYPAGQADHPVSGVTWADAWLYCAWLRYKTKLPYHLPTEAQWEKAATWEPVRGKKQSYPWGDKPDDSLCNLAASGHGGTTPVGNYSPKGDSPYGCADMIGNVDEWCNTVMWKYPYRTDDGREELTAPGRRGIRGGDWYTIANPSGVRRNAPSDWWQYLWGFRVALSSALDNAHQEIMRQSEKIIPEVRAAYAAEMEKKPDSAQVPYDWATWLFNLRQNGIDIDRLEVEAMLSRAVELVNQAASKPFWRGRQRALEDSPLSHVYFNRAVARRELQKYDGALADISQAIDLDKSDPDAFILRADLACDLGRWEQAEQDLSTALKLKPKHPSELKIRARIRAGREEWQTALEMLTEFIKEPLFTPLWQPKVYLWRAEVFEQLGKPDRAMSDYYHYYLWRPEAPEAEEIAEKIHEYLKQN